MVMQILDAQRNFPNFLNRPMKCPHIRLKSTLNGLTREGIWFELNNKSFCFLWFLKEREITHMVIFLNSRKHLTKAFYASVGHTRSATTTGWCNGPNTVSKRVNGHWPTCLSSCTILGPTENCRYREIVRVSSTLIYMRWIPTLYGIYGNKTNHGYLLGHKKIFFLTRLECCQLVTTLASTLTSALNFMIH